MNTEWSTSALPCGLGARYDRGRYALVSPDVSAKIPAGPKPILRWIFYAFVFAIPFEAVGVGEEGTGFTITKFIGYFLVLATFLQPRLCYRRPPLAFWCFAAYLWVYLCLNLVQESQYLMPGIMRLTTLVQMLVLFWISYNLLQSDRMVTSVLGALVASCVILAALQLAGITSMEYRGKSDRLTAFGQNPNALAAVLSLGLLTLIGLAYGRAGRTRLAKYITWPLLGMVALVIVRTGSRGPFVGLTAGVIAFLLTSGSMWVRIRNVTIALLALLVLIWATTTSETAVKRWEAALEGGNLSGRQRIYAASWAMFLERPLQGWGPVHNMAELGDRVHFGKARDTHNLLLMVLTETGLLGALPYVVGLWLCWRAAWRARRSIQGVLPLALFLCLLLVNMSSSWHNRKLHWLVLAYAAASGSYMVGRRSREQPALISSFGQPQYSRYRYARLGTKEPREAG
jgi:O-antigen ligase